MISQRLKPSRISEDLADIIYFLLTRGVTDPNRMESLERVVRYYVIAGTETLGWMLSALDFGKLRYSLNMTQMFQEYLDRMKILVKYESI